MRAEAHKTSWMTRKMGTLLKNENQRIHVLKSQGGKALVIDYISSAIPPQEDDGYLTCGPQSALSYHFLFRIVSKHYKVFAADWTHLLHMQYFF